MLAVAGMVLLATEMTARSSPISSNRGLIFVFFVAALPGAMLYRWGRGPVAPSRPLREILPQGFPPKTARQMGHVEDIPPGGRPFL